MRVIVLDEMSNGILVKPFKSEKAAREIYSNEKFYTRTRIIDGETIKIETDNFVDYLTVDVEALVIHNSKIMSIEIVDNIPAIII